LEYWQDSCDIILVEGVGGLMCPLEKDFYVADLAFYFGFPLVVVSRNALGTINHTLQTLITAATFREGLKIAGIVLNQPFPPGDDPSVSSNRQELAARCFSPVLAEISWQGDRFDSPVDWMRLAAAAGGTPERLPPS
jgi:dethiobiotin synthetase